MTKMSQIFFATAFFQYKTHFKAWLSALSQVPNTLRAIENLFLPRALYQKP